MGSPINSPVFGFNPSKSHKLASGMQPALCPGKTRRRLDSPVILEKVDWSAYNRKKDEQGWSSVEELGNGFPEVLEDEAFEKAIARVGG